MISVPASSALAERHYDAVLLDLNLPDSSGFETFSCVRQKAPDQAIIVLTGYEDEALALKAVRAGADEYLVKSEIRGRFLIQRILYALERNQLRLRSTDEAVKNGKIFSFIGAKGGCGTSTLVVNLAAALAKSGKSVLAIELDCRNSVPFRCCYAACLCAILLPCFGARLRPFRARQWHLAWKT